MKQKLDLFGQRLRHLRLESGIEVQRLAELTGMNAKTLRNIEAGRFGTLASTQSELAQALHVMEMDFYVWPGNHLRYDVVELTRFLPPARLAQLKRELETEVAAQRQGQAQVSKAR